MAVGFWRDRLLLGACAICALLIAYQLGVTILRPAWRAPVTDWSRAGLALPELLIVLFVSLQLSHARRPKALAWWMWSAGLFSYMIAQSAWSVDEQFMFPKGVPFPNLPDLFYLLQYPFFFLAVILLPHTRSWGPRLIMIVDGLLVMGAATALSWYFILAPISQANEMSLLARSGSLAYPVADLFVLLGLTMTLLRPSRYPADRLVLDILVLAVACLIVADSWSVGYVLYSSSHVYRAGNPPDLFWDAFYLLIPLAGLVQLRLVQHEPLRSWGAAAEAPARQPPQWHDLVASLRFFFPLVAALLASAVIMLHAIMTMGHIGWRDLLVPMVVSSGLLLLALLRQELAFLENAQLRREAEVARANEMALREINRRKDEFLGIASHELKTPLTSLRGYIELMARRFNAWRPEEGGGGAEGLARNVAMARTAITYADDSVRRIARLVDDLLDDARIRDGRLAFHLEPCDLGAIVQRAVEEQRALASDRTIRLELPAARPVPIFADAGRIGQVVTNYLTNALKYSKEDRPIEVRLEVEGAVARVSVRDEGVGVPVSEQAHVWERFHRVAGIEVQSGSGVGLGIGLHISKTIIEGHHGQVGVESAPGQGSTFWFTLPLARPNG